MNPREHQSVVLGNPESDRLKASAPRQSGSADPRGWLRRRLAQWLERVVVWFESYPPVAGHEYHRY